MTEKDREREREKERKGWRENYIVAALKQNATCYQ